MSKGIFAVVAVAVAAACCHAGESAYPVNAKAGNWMILVQSFSGDPSNRGNPATDPAILADELCASLRRDYRVAAYVYNRGDEERRKERERIEALRRQQRELVRQYGAQLSDKDLPRIKTIRIEDQFAVLIGGWKDQEDARKALDKVRELTPPAEKYQHRATIVESSGNNRGQVRTAGINPFRTAFVVHNPTVSIPVDPEKGKLRNLKEFNEDESLSLLKCRKPYTLIVKTYQGAVRLQQSDAPTGSFLDKLTGNSKPGQLLNASAQQAHSTAEALKQIKDARGHSVIATDVYVLHTEHSSYVTVGAFDRPDDPVLLQYQRKLAGLQLGPERLSAQPLPMPVPKP